ncbi:tRNA (adenosine(37)-N6)-dimethylallyltransferase MiaA [Buchnera aphidicola]|uniref:tRNA (adenosine(37)-N6)-dimethylallyltransferase MiaA n=1 Tax=Buchnera aphidicola TaxID=9 RepID=UPI0031B88856
MYIKNHCYHIKNKNFLIFLMGPTASGKSKIAMILRNFLPVELISVDSALIYKDMDIGTSKPSQFELYHHPHRLINLLDPKNFYSAFDFRKDALNEIQKILRNNKIPLLVGGTMLYFHFLLYGSDQLPKSNIVLRKKLLYEVHDKNSDFLYQYLLHIDFDSAKDIHPHDIQRIIRAIEIYLLTGKKMSFLIKEMTTAIPYDIIQFGIFPQKDILHKNIKNRFYHMLHQGFEREVWKLFNRNDLSFFSPGMRCIGYREMWMYFLKMISYNEMIKKSIISTFHLAKKQITWLKKWKNIIFIHDSDIKKIISLVLKKIYEKYCF